MRNMTEKLYRQHEFHIADYVVFGLALFVSLGIGVFHGFMSRRKNNTDEYLVGGRSMSILPTAISLLASFESSIMMLGTPAEAYNFGPQYILWIFGSCVVNFFSATIVVPLFYPLRITSVFEYLELRFKSRAARLVGTALGTLSYIWYMGIVLFGPAVALEAVSGYPVWNSIIVITVVAVIYTSIGGIKAVIWTDVFQAGVMLAGVFAILIQGTMEVGGAKKVWDTAAAGGRMNFLNFDPDPRVRHTFWNILIGSLPRGFGLVFNQSTVQRISSTKSVHAAKRMLQCTAPAFFFTISIALYEGVVAYAYYQHKGCDPMASDQITDMNQIIPYTVMDIFSRARGMPGLFMASVFCASLSTLSSGLASSASLTWTDVVHPLVGDISESKSTIIIKITVVIFGAIACAVSFMVAEIGGSLTQIAGSLIPSFSAPVTGIFLLGCFFPRSNAKGAMVGAFISFSVCVWISMGQSFSPNVPKPVKLPPASTDKCYLSLLNTTDTTESLFDITTTMLPTTQKASPSGVELLYTISYMYIAPIGTFGTIIIGCLASYFFGMNKPGDVDPRYLLSATDSFLFFLPGPTRRWISSIGPQFMDDKYRSNSDDKSQNPAVEMDSEPKVAVISEKTMTGALGDKNVKSYDLQESYKF